MNRARYSIVQGHGYGDALVLRDIGPWHKHPTVTNDADAVVAELVDGGLLGPTQQLLYYDSEGTLDELLHAGRWFRGFAPGPRL